MKIVFPFLAQFHQIPHSLPIAIELARRHPTAEVHVAFAGMRYLPFIRALVDDYAPGTRLHYDCLKLDPFNRMRTQAGKTPWKIPALLLNRSYFDDFDAIVTPERTSLFLRSIGVSRPKMIWTRHGAGDRSVGFAKDIHRYDFVLMASRRIERRLLELGQIRPGDYAVGVYAKFDWLRVAGRPVTPVFDNDRPTVLYNPHFRPSLSSWPKLGLRVLEQFADSQRYNLIFAPHIRLFDTDREKHQEAFRRFRDLGHLHIDLGSDRSIDMSYTRAADLYLGDVSSQVCEFLHTPRPCLFLNAHAAQWRGNPNYDFWRLGEVSQSAERIEAQVDAAFASHAQYREIQSRHFQQTFEMPDKGTSAGFGADAIVSYLRRRQLMPQASPLPQHG